MTQRRWVGLIAVMLGLLAAVVVPLAAGQTVPGAAEAVPVPGPPAVGDCVGQRFDPAWDLVGGNSAQYRYPELDVGSCSEAHYGEVVQVIPRPTTPRVGVDSGGSYSVQDKNMDACNQAAGRFVGRDGAAPGSTLLFGYWSDVMIAPAVVLTPTGRQQAAGQHWLACATYLFDSLDGGQRSLVKYQGSLRSAQTTGASRDHLGYCPDNADWNHVTSMSCRKPHRGEIFGIGGISTDVPRTTLTQSCTKLVSQAMKGTALGRSGGLVVAVQAATGADGKTASGATIPAGSTAQCGVLTTGGRMLKGSVIALGTEPIPWT